MGKFFSYAVIFLLLTGCTTTKYIPVESFRTDSVYITRHTHDTLRTLDSVYIHEKGDTVFYEHWRTQYKSVLRTDTMLVTERDTIRVPYEVEAQLTEVERVQMWFGKWIMSGILVAIIVALGLFFARCK